MFAGSGSCFAGRLHPTSGQGVRQSVGFSLRYGADLDSILSGHHSYKLFSRYLQLHAGSGQWCADLSCLPVPKSAWHDLISWNLTRLLIVLIENWLLTN